MKTLSVIKKKLCSMRYSKKEVQKETSQDAKQFMYGYTECINDLLEYINAGGDGVPEHELFDEFSALKDQSGQPKHDIQEFMTDVHKWADATFGTQRTALAPLYHLKKEVDEAIETMQTHNQWLTVEELADCFILILNSSSKYGLTFDELFIAAKDKMIRNKSRKWGNPDKNGVVEHVREEYEKYNEQYLNDCIEKATPGLSKIADVDKALDEIRGIEPRQTVEEVLESVYREEWSNAFPNDIALDRAIKIVKACQEWSICITAMEEYAQNQQPKEITNLEIEAWAAGKVNEIDPDEYGYGDLLIMGAKFVRDWYRDKLNKK